MTDKYFINEDRLGQNEVFLGCIANEIAEQNRLKKIELKLKIIEMSTTVSMDFDPSLSKVEAVMFNMQVDDESNQPMTKSVGMENEK